MTGCYYVLSYSYKKMTDTPDFQIRFNRKRQSINVFLWDVHPTTFSNWKMGRWGVFIPKWSSPSSGFFGSIHFVDSVKRPLRVDTVTHELLHTWIEWIWANRTGVINRNEETMVSLYDELVRNFYREYNKL